MHWLFVPSTVDAALAYLDLFDLTNDAKYIDAAKAIADTLLKRQDADGTWPNMVDYETNKPAAPQRMIPTWVIFLFDRLRTQYHHEGYQASRAKAWNWIVEHPLKTYQWDGQFEDIKLHPPYINLAREQACDVAVLLLSNPKYSNELAQAQELIRFAEDQFAIWAPVKDVAGWQKAMPNRNKTTADWITPGVFEQYVCYAPVARSAAILINTYLKAHEVTHNPQYLEKAKALANGMLEGQAYFAKNFNSNGEIPTWGIKKKPVNWLNNSFYAADAVLNVAHYTAATQPSVK
jgi:maltose/maltodextrin transport system substrate-binding protein